MVEKYKTNKSPLNKFLKKKSDEKFNTKPFVGKSCEYFVKLLKLAETANIEDLTRLKACGCNIEGNLLLTVRDFPAKILSRWYEMSRKENENNNYYALRGQNSLAAYFGVWCPPTYYIVGGVSYKDREEFLLKSTALGRALI